jgi:hypothetical protein
MIGISSLCYLYIGAKFIKGILYRNGSKGLVGSSRCFKALADCTRLHLESEGFNIDA